MGVAGHILRGVRKLMVPVALAVWLPAGAAAQTTLADLAGGSRVRVSATSLGSSPLTARVVSASPDTLVVQTAEDGRRTTLRIPASQITRLDVSRGLGRGRKSQFAGIGFLVGAGIAQLISHESSGTSPGLDEGDIGEFTDSVLLGGIGAAIGAYLGRAQEDWRRVQLGETQLSLRLPLTTRGAGLRAAIAF